MKRIFITLVILFAIGIEGLYASGKQPKYIFYFIGDGMGASQVYIANSYLKSKGEKGLSFTSFPVLGLVDTECHGRQITDSAAAGTALATGVRTTEGMIGMSRDTVALENISTTLHNRGMKVGIISTASIDHATPASFYAHQPSRDMYFEISEELPTSNFEFFGGGGILENDNFNDKVTKQGYRVVNTKGAIDSLKNGDEKVIAISPTLQDSKSMTYAIDRKEGEFTLADFVKKGIEVLDNEKGFFMMAEGGKIDWLAHAGDVGSTIREIIDFDKAIDVALDFYNKHPKETIIIVTSDHDTGGYAAGSTLKGYNSDYKVFGDQKMSYYNFSNKVDEYRNAPSRKKDISFALQILKDDMGLTEFTDTELDCVKEAFKQSMIPYKSRNRDDAYWSKYGGYDPLTVAAIKIMAHRAGVGTTTFYHTAAPVLIQAIGVGADKFIGRLENREIPIRLLK
ncbi:MAG: alkaline phosphatase [Rikenellaceae bacterium]